MQDLLCASCPELKVGPSPLAFIGFPNDRYPPIVHWGVMLARTGWHTGETRLLPLRDGLVPDVLTITPEQADAPLGNVMIAWPAHLPRLSFRVRVNGRTSMDIFEVTVEPGQTTPVPPGKYQLEADLATGRPKLSRPDFL
jgi:hypothetical protein